MNNYKAWDYAIGIVQVDGIQPSREFLELVEGNTRTTITFMCQFADNHGMPIDRTLFEKGLPQSHWL